MTAKIFGVVGYKDSGKTTLTHALARELTARGHRVAVVKHTRHRHPLDTAGKDTAVLGEVVEQVAIITPQEAALFWKRPPELAEVVAHLDADLVLVEGFKEEPSFPRIVCLRGLPDDADLFVGTVVGAVGPGRYAAEGVPLFERDAIHALADVVEEVSR